MTGSQPRKAELKRWREDIVRHLEDFPRQYAALETAMAMFGEDFDRRLFKEAFDTLSDMEAYNHVQAVERAVGRVHNYVADLADAGVKLAQLRRPPMRAGGSAAQQSFEALRDAEVIDAALCRRLARAQKARSTIEHSYIRVNAGDVHRAALLIQQAAHDFIGPYRKWIADHLREAGPPPGLPPLPQPRSRP
ncbi:MAG: hypothetical protein ACRDLF_11545 [Solirubrobacteraceae bacterium]